MNTQISFWDKPRVRLKEDSILNKDFKKGTEWEILFEQEENYIILLNGVYYGPLKESCERVS